MPLIATSTRHALRIRNNPILRQRWAIPRVALASAPHRCFYDGGQNLAVEEVAADFDKTGGDLKKYILEYKASFTAPKPTFIFDKSIPLSQIGQSVTAVGYVGKRRDISRAFTFAPLYGGNNLDQVQMFARSEINDEARRALREIPESSAVSVTGVLDWKYDAKIPRKKINKRKEDHCWIDEVEIRVQKIECLASFPKSLKLQPNQQFEPKYRHLQIRFDDELRKRLQFRSKVATFARTALSDFQEVETPILFKSTPEGAREFIVPTRRRGFAYGLPQSPQQYKQILMASGVYRYVQFAKCFRDEDYRADRQPEFTQIDLEMAWADGEDVMQRVEQFMKDLWKEFARPDTTIRAPLPDSQFPRMTYDEAMSSHGSDKPDLRIKHLIHRVEHIVPDDLRGMLTSIRNPIIEACKFRLNGDTATVQEFIRDFMDSPDAEEFRNNAAGAPGIFVVDLRRPLEGLQAFGFERAEYLKDFYAETRQFDKDFEEGDLLLLQARENLPHSGGSTMMGKLRLALHKAAIAKELIEPDLGHHFLWVTDFPMFTLNDGSEPGQEGDSGFSSTHHPFTAPKTATDVDILMTDPLKAIADHYDIVLNGVELGGGSRRIHNAEVQKFVMREILKINARRMSDFSHLFLALGAGCPPHAGLAIGFDRLIAMMQGRDSVRDVIAFPKDKNGADLMAKTPTQLSQQRLADYHLEIKDSKRILEREQEAREIEAQKVASLESLKILLDQIATWGANPDNSERPSVAKANTDEEQNHSTAKIEITRTEPVVDDNAEVSTVEEDAIDEDTRDEEIVVDETPLLSTPKDVPRYAPGELLSYAVMLYHQVGGNFLHETLKGFETLIESLGEEMTVGNGPDQGGKQNTQSLKEPSTTVQRLEKLHSQLMKDIFGQMQRMESAHMTSGSSQNVEDLREQFEDALEPVRMLQQSLKTLEHMLETLNKELDKRIQEHTVRLDEAAQASASESESEGQPASGPEASP